jgi:hypothetical protein
MGSAWTEGEVDDLAERWQEGWAWLSLPGACPHCDHNGAFSKVSVPKEIATNLGDRYLQQPGIRESVPGTYPPRWAVTCQCGHADHGDDGGCGRSGHVTIPPR